jgi:hypothetical protein
VKCPPVQLNQACCCSPHETMGVPEHIACPTADSSLRSEWTKKK